MDWIMNKVGKEMKINDFSALSLLDERRFTKTLVNIRALQMFFWTK